MTYMEKLRDPRWQKKRLEALSAADWQCSSCGDKTSTLNVHHKKYRKGAEPWDYEQSELQVVCEKCHGARHALQDLLNEPDLGASSADILGLVLGFLMGTESAREQDLSAKHGDLATVDCAIFGMLAGAVKIGPIDQRTQVFRILREFKQARGQ